MIQQEPDQDGDWALWLCVASLLIIDKHPLFKSCQSAKRNTAKLSFSFSNCCEFESAIVAPFFLRCNGRNFQPFMLECNQRRQVANHFPRKPHTEDWSCTRVIRPSVSSQSPLTRSQSIVDCQARCSLTKARLTNAWRQFSTWLIMHWGFFFF